MFFVLGGGASRAYFLEATRQRGWRGPIFSKVAYCKDLFQFLKNSHLRATSNSDGSTSPVARAIIGSPCSICRLERGARIREAFRIVGPWVLLSASPRAPPCPFSRSTTANDVPLFRAVNSGAGMNRREETGAQAQRAVELLSCFLITNHCLFAA